MMAEVLPFKGLLYNTSKVKIEDVVAPPYDIISSEEQNKLYEKSPYNVVRLILGKRFASDDDEDNRYIRARVFLERWLQEEILVKDDEEKGYIYKQAFYALGRRWERTAFIFRVRLEDFSSGQIFPHEKTLSEPKEDRLRLLRECKTNFSPIFGLFPDDDERIQASYYRLTQHTPLFSFSDEEDVAHHLWALKAESLLHVLDAFSDRFILIADGHHRYETALQYMKECTIADSHYTSSKPYNFVMMALVSMRDPGLLVLPIHRVLRGSFPFSERDFFDKMGDYFQVRASFSDLADLLETLGKADGCSLGIKFAQGPYVLFDLKDQVDLERLLGDYHPVLRTLDVIIIHTLILERILGVSPEEVRDSSKLGYYKDPNEAVREIDEGKGSMAIFLRSSQIEDIKRVALAGETMPQKSTYFYPKLKTGLVMNPLF
jgi:uncharacterized protein (DUF1015 family)